MSPRFKWCSGKPQASNTSSIVQPCGLASASGFNRNCPNSSGRRDARPALRKGPGISGRTRGGCGANNEPFRNRGFVHSASALPHAAPVFQRAGASVLGCSDALRCLESVPKWHNQCAKLAQCQETTRILEAGTAVPYRSSSVSPAYLYRSPSQYLVIPYTTPIPHLVNT